MVCWNKPQSNASSEECTEKPSPFTNKTKKHPLGCSSPNDSTKVGEEEEVVHDSADKATRVSADKEDNPPRGRRFGCKQLCSSSPHLKAMRVDGILSEFDLSCCCRFKAVIQHLTPAKILELVTWHESAGKQSTLQMVDAGVTCQCKAMDENCQWQDIVITTACMACNSNTHMSWVE